MTKWLKDTVERTVRTVGQAVAAAVLAYVTATNGWDNISWANIGKVAGYAAVLTFLTCVVAGHVGSKDDASLIPPE